MASVTCTTMLNQKSGPANQSQSPQTDVQPRTIEEIRKQGLDPSVLQQIAADKAEMDRIEKEKASRLTGNYISFKEDKEQKTLLFTGRYQKLNVPLKDYTTKQVIEGKFVPKWRFEVYDITDYENPSDPSIWERGWREAKIVLHFMEQKKTELVVVRNGAKDSTNTTYLIYPAK